MMNNDKEIELLDHQYDAMTAEEPFVALVTGLGGGKTWTGARWLLLRAYDNSDSLHLATGNSYRQIQDVVVPELISACQQWELSFTWKKSDSNLLIHLGGKTAIIRVRSTEPTSVDKLRGPEYGSVWMDEARECSSYSFGVVLGRLRCRKVDRPSYLLTTTPAGHDWIWERHVERDDPTCRLIRATSMENPFLPDHYIKDLKAEYDVEMAKQEIEGAFVDLTGARSYHAFDRTVHVRPCAYQPNLPLFLCFDPGWRVMACVIDQDRGHAVEAIGEIVQRQGTIASLCDAVIEKYPSPSRSAGAVVFGDPAGRHKSEHSGKTFYALIKERLEPHFGRLEFDVGKAAPAQSDRVNSANAMFRNAAGQVRAYVDPSCKELIRDREQVRWNDHGKLDKSDIKRTHCSDAEDHLFWRRYRPEVFRSEPRYRMNGMYRPRRLRDRYESRR